MKKSKFTEERITYALRQVESGTPPADVCRQLGVSEATLYILGANHLCRQLRAGLSLGAIQSCGAVFTSIDDARTKIEAWRVDYNQRRPHGSLGHLTPDEYAQQPQKSPTGRAAFFLRRLSRFGTNVRSRSSVALGVCFRDQGRTFVGHNRNVLTLGGLNMTLSSPDCA